MLPQAVGLFKHILNLFCIINAVGRELYIHYVSRYTFNTGLFSELMSLIN